MGFLLEILKRIWPRVALMGFVAAPILYRQYKNSKILKSVLDRYALSVGTHQASAPAVPVQSQLLLFSVLCDLSLMYQQHHPYLIFETTEDHALVAKFTMAQTALNDARAHQQLETHLEEAFEGTGALVSLSTEGAWIVVMIWFGCEAHGHEE